LKAQSKKIQKSWIFEIQKTRNFLAFKNKKFLKWKKNQKILFINPRQSVSKDTKHLNIKFPLGFLYMAGALKDKGFEVKIVDCPLYYQYKSSEYGGKVKIGLPDEKVLKLVEEFNPNIIGVSCPYSMYESDSFELIDLLKKRFPKKMIVIGGAHSSANPSYVLRNKNIAMVVIGEGEETMLEIASKYSSGKNINNIRGTALMQKGKFKMNRPRDYIQDLDQLHPAWEIIEIPQYFSHPDNSAATMRKNSIDIVTSRGCPGICSFCSIHTVWGRKWRARTAGNVVDEIEMLHKKYGARQFRFQDDNLTLDKKRILEICNEIQKRKLDITWDTPNGVAIWTLDKEMLLKMKQSGCYRVTFGVESASKETQKYVGKIIDLKKINELVDYCHKIGLWVCATFIIGFPEEKLVDLHKTIDFIVSSKINFPFIYIAQPYQGTKMFNDFAKHGLIPEGFKNYSNLENTYYDTVYLKSAELNKLLGEVKSRFYKKKFVSYLNPATFYTQFASKIGSFEDLNYILKTFKAIIFK